MAIVLSLLLLVSPFAKADPCAAVPGAVGDIRCALAGVIVTDPGPSAEAVGVPLDHGFWKEKKARTVSGWLDLAVRNPNGQVHGGFVRVTSHFENGTSESMLYRLAYKDRLADGQERWGTSDMQLLQRHDAHGRVVSVDVSYGLQVDEDGDGSAALRLSESEYRLATPDALRNPTNNLGTLSVSGANPDRDAPRPDTSRARDASIEFQSTIPPVEVRFAPYDDPEQTIRAEIDTVIAAMKADPGGYHFIHAAVYNINDPRITEKLIEAHLAGVEVKLLTDSSQLDPRRSYQTEYRRLERAGIEVTGIVRTGDFASSHTKIAVFDGKVATTGSFNWESRSADSNNENLVVVRSPTVAAVYEQMFQTVGGAPPPDRPIVPDGAFNVYYSLHDNIPAVLWKEIEAAKESIVVSMFTLRHLEFEQDGQKRDLLDALVRARQRGVQVSVLTERNISGGGEYYGRITPDDPTDEWLAGQGIEVVEIHTEMNGDPYAAMHHKFAVVDERTSLTGSYNWFHGSQVSDDDLLVIRDTDIARRYLGEVNNLRLRYDPSFDPGTAPQTQVEFQAFQEATRPGDVVCVVGDIPQIGSWDESRAVPLDPSDWPTWKATVPIPAGTNFQYKYIIRRADGTTWELGNNRVHTASCQGGADPLADRMR